MRCHGHHTCAAYWQARHCPGSHWRPGRARPLAQSTRAFRNTRQAAAYALPWWCQRCRGDPCAGSDAGAPSHCFHSEPCRASWSTKTTKHRVFNASMQLFMCSNRVGRLRSAVRVSWNGRHLHYGLRLADGYHDNTHTHTQTHADTHLSSREPGALDETGSKKGPSCWGSSMSKGG